MEGSLPAVAGIEAMPTASSSSSLGSRGARAQQPKEVAVALVARALQPTSHVDFPQITEICERVEAYPQEATGTVKLLVAALRDPRASPHAKLKALTILNEMMYNDHVVAVVCSIEGSREALMELRRMRNAGGGEVIEENIRMLATEIEKRCNSSVPVKQRSSTGSQFTAAGREGLDWLNRSAMDKLQKAKSLEKAFQNSEFHGFLTKWERKVERGVHNAMGWQMPSSQENKGLPSTSSASRPQKQPQAVPGVPVPNFQGGAHVGAVQQGRPVQTADEDWELQWAIRQSLAESKTASAKRSAAAAAAAGSPAFDESMLRRLQETEEREAAAQKEVNQLRRQLMDSRLFITGLSERLAVAQAEVRKAEEAEKELTRECEARLQGLQEAATLAAEPDDAARPEESTVKVKCADADNQARQAGPFSASTSEPETASGSNLPDAGDSEVPASTQLAEGLDSPTDSSASELDEQDTEAAPMAEAVVDADAKHDVRDSGRESFATVS